MGVLGALETILGLDDNQMKSAAVDIFSYIVEFSPSMVREFIVQEGQKQDDVSINCITKYELKKKAICSIAASIW